MYRRVLKAVETLIARCHVEEGNRSSGRDAFEVRAFKPLQLPVMLIALTSLRAFRLSAVCLIGFAFGRPFLFPI